MIMAAFPWADTARSWHGLAFSPCLTQAEMVMGKGPWGWVETVRTHVRCSFLCWDLLLQCSVDDVGSTPSSPGSMSKAGRQPLTCWPLKWFQVAQRRGMGNTDGHIPCAWDWQRWVDSRYLLDNSYAYVDLYTGSLKLLQHYHIIQLQ